MEKKFIETLSPTHAARIGELLDIFTKTELLNQAKMLGLDIKGKGSLKKEEVIDFLLENVASQEIIGALSFEPRALSNEQTPIIKLNFEQELMMFKFLFFGSRHGDMTEFVIRDLGFRQYQTFDEEKLVAYFSTRQEAEDKLKVSLAREDFQLMVDAQLEPLQIYTWFMDWTDVHKPHLSEIALPTYERLTLKVGAYLERQKQHDHALTVFRFTQQTPSRERQVRILYKDKNLSEAQALCEQILIDYQNADEQFFAIDYLNRLTAEAQKKKTKKATTLQLDNSSMVSIDIGWKYRVEMGVIDYYNRQEINAVHSENFLWRSFFGLLFWDIIFDTETLAIHHPLQRSPSDLYKPIFWEKRRNRLVERLELLDQPEELREYLLQIFLEKYATTNPLVDWFQGLLDWILALLYHVEAEKLKLILLEMAKNIRENTRGFPDLFTWNEKEYEFVEVKSPTDSLSNQQLYWLRFFEKIGVKSKVLRVEWSKADLEELKSAE